MELSEEIEEELTCLESILLDTITVDRKAADSVKVDLKLGPLTASDDDLMYVGMVLSLSLSQDYPDRSPKIEIKSPRGLNEEQVDFMMNEMRERCVTFSKTPVIFELVNFCQEYLTERNVPSCPCPICLTSLEPHHEFCKTACYHYFHSFCLGKYYKSLEGDEQKVLCPVCREDVSSTNFGKLCHAEEPEETPKDPEQEQKYVALAKLSQTKLRAVYEKQLVSGSIIDAEADKNRRLITIAAGPREPPTSSLEPSPVTPEAAPQLPKSSNKDNKWKRHQDHDRSQRHQGRGHHRRQRGRQSHHQKSKQPVQDS